MGINRTYQRTCDKCGKFHPFVATTARRAIRAASKDGWQRVVDSTKVVGWWIADDICAECYALMNADEKVAK